MSFEFTPPPSLRDLTPATLAAVSDDELEGALAGYVADRISEAGDESAAVDRLPPGLQTWYLTFLLDAEILNGGFNQFFFNPTGQYAGLLPAALEEIGAADASTLILRALELVGQHAPALEAAAEEGTIDAFMATYLDQPFAELDAAYAQRESEWREARIRFIRAHASTIGLP